MLRQTAENARFAKPSATRSMSVRVWQSWVSLSVVAVLGLTMAGCASSPDVSRIVGETVDAAGNLLSPTTPKPAAVIGPPNASEAQGDGPQTAPTPNAAGVESTAPSAAPADTPAASAAADASTASIGTTSDRPGRAAPQGPWSIPGSAPAAYERVARGLLRCHLSYGQALNKDYLLFAETPPNATTAEAVIHQRTKENRHGLRYYRVEMFSFAGQTRISITNLKFPRDVAADLRETIFRWSQGRSDCPT